MTVRIFTEEVNYGAAAAGVPGAKAEIRHRSFDIESPELEEFLKGEGCFVLGAEVLSPTHGAAADD